MPYFMRGRSSGGGIPYIGFAGRVVSVEVGSGLLAVPLAVPVTLVVDVDVGWGSGGIAVGAVSVAVAVAVDAVSTGTVSEVVGTVLGIVVAGVESPHAPSRVATAMAAPTERALSRPQKGQRVSARRMCRLHCPQGARRLICLR